MSAWKCEKCGWEGRTTQKSGHATWHCPKQGRMKKVLDREAREAALAAAPQAAPIETPPPPPKFFQYLACVCRCGTQIGQVKGQKKRQFVDAEHYEKWRKDTLHSAGGDGQTVEARKHAEEVAAVVAKETAIQRAAEVVPIITGEASFRIWARCLGFAVDGAQLAA